MKKLMKIVGILLGIVALVVILFVAYIQIKGVPHYPVEMTEQIKNLKVTVDSAHVAEGKRISSMLCRECHYSPETKKLTGSPRTDIPKEFGAINSLNITQDKTHGVGNWTDGELYYFLRTGIRPQTGEYVPPYMPKFPHVSDDDVHSIIAWLRSDDPELAADPHEYPPNQANFLVKLLCNIAFKPLPLPTGPITEPDTTDLVALGKYVADGVIGCYACHSADLKTLNDQDPPKTPGFYGGGTKMLDLDGVTEVATANITMDEETGIGKWTEQQFLEAVKYCKKPDGGLLHYPMAPHAALTDTEVKAIYAYLKTVPVIQNKVERFQASN
ncbi:MAG: c-type cytochrome [Lewinellaceae bacterium]|nr:c-type cytochrome [Lewinellaceae bacterium]